MTLFRSIEEIKQHNSSVTMGLSLSSLRSFLDDAINNHIIEAIGQATFDELLGAKSAEVYPNSETKYLIHIVQKTCTHFAIANYIPFGSLQLSDAGAHVQSDNNLKPASDKKIAELRSQALEDGYTSLEMVINFLEDNLNIFTTYAKSKNHLNNRSLFINTSKDFIKSVPISVNAQMFANMRAEIEYIERSMIEPILGNDLTNTLHNKIKANTSFSTPEIQLINNIQRVVAPLTLASLVQYKTITIGTDGVCRAPDNISIDSRSESYRLGQEVMYLNKRGETELEELKSFLNKNKDLFPTCSKKESKVSSINTATSNIYFI